MSGTVRNVRITGRTQVSNRGAIRKWLGRNQRGNGESVVAARGRSLWESSGECGAKCDFGKTVKFG